MFMPERRALLIMHHLVNASRPVSAETLASVLGTSSRTVRNDLLVLDRILNRIGAAIVSKKGVGYEIEAADAAEMRIFVDSLNGVIRSTPASWVSDRVDVLIHTLLFAPVALKSEELADAFHVSRTTLSSDLRHVREALETYHLKLSHRPGSGLLVGGSETHLRWAMVSYLFIDEDMAVPAIPDVVLNLDTKTAHDALRSLVVSQGMHIGADSLHELATLACVSAARFESGHAVDLSSVEKVRAQHLEEKDLATRFWADVGREMPRREVDFLALALASRRTFGMSDNFSLSENKDLFFLADDLLRELFSLTDVNLLLNEPARLLLARELRGLRIRAELGYELRRSRATDAERPQAIVEYAVLIANRLQAVHGLWLSDVELANLALVLSIAMRGSEPATAPRRLCAVFSQGLPVALDIAWKVERLFPGLVGAVDPRELHELTAQECEGFDLILTDLPQVRFPIGARLLRTSPTLDGAARAALEDRLLRRSETADELVSRLSPAAFIPRLATASRDDALRAVCERLVPEPGVDPGLFEAVLHRENRISTELGSNCAVAHSLTAVAQQTVVGAAVLRRPVPWRHDNVQVLFVVANGRDEGYSFRVVSQLKEALQSAQLIDRLVRGQVESFAEFRELMRTSIAT